ncbi:hypothetical protein [Solobacterium moorei]|uniref:carboxylesterase family protein n=1 Tax=Solobacterium moorei TaxID=102148 RepID=UPI0023EFBE5F|nr:hypothetical protein [Solobacterium moorei]
MNNTLKMILACALLLPIAGCGAEKKASVAGSDVITGAYDMTITGYDWGCGTDSIIMNLDYPLDTVSTDSFTVTEHKQATNFMAEGFPVEEVDVPRQVTNAYLVDESGKKTTEPSTRVKLELYVSPNDGSPLLFSFSSMMNTWSHPYTLTVTKANNAKLTSKGTEVKDFTISIDPASKTTSADKFKLDTFKAKDGVTYQYASYKPEGGSKKLVVWLHGLGEGGTDNTDPYVTLLANKAAVLGDESFQSTVGGANVLVPQCPTYWMDNDGKMTNFTGGGIQADGTSHYLESLHELIAKYKEETGSTKVVIAGCSNGGYMTMLMALNYPTEYDAYVPICEALPNSLITDEQVKTLANLKMYYVYSQDDTTVVPELHEVPLLQRLEAAGAKNTHVSVTEHIVDTTGTYYADVNGQPTLENTGKPYQYMGHWSWIYFFNNTCDANDLKAWDFIANAVK